MDIISAPERWRHLERKHPAPALIACRRREAGSRQAPPGNEPPPGTSGRNVSTSPESVTPTKTASPSAATRSFAASSCGAADSAGPDPAASAFHRCHDSCQHGPLLHDPNHCTIPTQNQGFSWISDREGMQSGREAAQMCSDMHPAHKLIMPQQPSSADLPARTSAATAVTRAARRPPPPVSADRPPPRRAAPLRG